MATATLSSSSGERTSFSADTEGQYIVRLTASSSATGSSRTDSLVIEVDDGLATAPRDLSFYTDISTRLATCAGTCHDSGLLTGIPVWWVADASQPQGIPASTSDTPSRVNLDYIEDSLILKKPSNKHHYGGLRTGFDTSLPVGSAGRDQYDKFVNWIAEGAVCGLVGAECPDTN